MFFSCFPTSWQTYQRPTSLLILKWAPHDLYSCVISYWNFLQKFVNIHHKEMALSRFLTYWQAYQRLTSLCNTSISSTWLLFVCFFILNFSSKVCPQASQGNYFVSFADFLKTYQRPTSISSSWFVFVCFFILNFLKKFVHKHHKEMTLSHFLTFWQTYQRPTSLCNTLISSSWFVFVCFFILNFSSKLCPQASQRNCFVSFSDFLTNLPETNLTF